MKSQLTYDKRARKQGSQQGLSRHMKKHDSSTKFILLQQDNPGTGVMSRHMSRDI